MSIRINDLTVRFKNGVVAVNKASLEIPKGIYGLLGENGAGKTTLMRVLTTVLKQTEGLVSLDGILYNEGNYEKIQETLGTIYLMTANLPQAKTHFKRAFKIYEKIWADEPEMIEAKYQEIQELYPQIGFCIGKNLSGLLTK